jgi:hypothetical protein
MCIEWNVVISFECKVNETVRYQCRSEDLSLVSDKEIFSIGECFFFYMYNRNGKVSTYSLREISKKEYFARKSEIFNLRPNGRFGRYKKDGNDYFIGCFRDVEWRKKMPMLDCILMSDSPLKQRYNEVYDEVLQQHQQNKEEERYSRKEYARVCGGLGYRLGISYVNVLRIGTNEDELIEFKRTYEKAIEKVKKLPLAELRMLQIALFRNSRPRRRAAMEYLGIKYFNADVQLMDLSELEKVIVRPLDEYAKYCVEVAIEGVMELSFSDRQKSFDDLMNGNRRVKRELLAKLGIDTEALDINIFPFAKVKYAIQSSLGLDNY